MNPHDPFQQPQGNSVPQTPPQQFGPLDPTKPSIQPQVPNEQLFDTTPGVVQQQQPQAQQVNAPQQQSAPQAAAPNPSPYVLPPKPSKLWMIIAIIIGVIALGVTGGFVWAMLQYMDHRDNVDSKVTAAVATAVKEQADKDAADFLEKEKQPNRLFVGPDDYGRLAFNYPKTWSTYVDKDALKGGTYAAYLNPVVVPPVGVTGQQYALRVLIEEKDYDKVVDLYKDKVKKGDLKSAAVKADEQNGTRLDGQFTKDVRGSAVIFKLRDKTVTIQTDAEVFKADFDALIETITFNK